MDHLSITAYYHILLAFASCLSVSWFRATRVVKFGFFADSFPHVKVSLFGVILFCIVSPAVLHKEQKSVKVRGRSTKAMTELLRVGGDHFAWTWTQTWEQTCASFACVSQWPWLCVWARLSAGACVRMYERARVTLASSFYMSPMWCGTLCNSTCVRACVLVFSWKRKCVFMCGGPYVGQQHRPYCGTKVEGGCSL